MSSIQHMVQVHRFDERYYVSIDAGPWRAATLDEVRELLGL